jgi:hypothetical protein
MSNFIWTNEVGDRLPSTTFPTAEAAQAAGYWAHGGERGINERLRLYTAAFGSELWLTLVGTQAVLVNQILTVLLAPSSPVHEPLFEAQLKACIAQAIAPLTEEERAIVDGWLAQAGYPWSTVDLTPTP